MSERFSEPENHRSLERLKPLLERPQEVFDSPLEHARAEAAEVAEAMRRGRELVRRNGNVEIKFGGFRQPIQITWGSEFDRQAVALRLDPIGEGTGHEGGVLAYRGQYGVVSKDADFQFNVWDRDRTLSLEQLFMTPAGVDLYVLPTAVRWAAGKDVDIEAMFGKDAYVMYMGLGFLLLRETGHKWMHVGMHEAGHLPNQPDENIAWATANQNYASLYRGDKQAQREIVAGDRVGRFGILEKPARYGNKTTIGQVARYGLVSHALGGNARIPQLWQKSAGQTMEEFKRIVSEAQAAFDEVTFR